MEKIKDFLAGFVTIIIGLGVSTFAYALIRITGRGIALAFDMDTTASPMLSTAGHEFGFGMVLYLSIIVIGLVVLLITDLGKYLRN